MAAHFGGGGNGTSARVYYTSQSGCQPIASLSSPQAGPDATADLQAIANLGQSGPIEIVVDQPLLCSEIKLYSGTTIRGLSPAAYPGSAPPDTGLWMKANPSASPGGSASCVLRNAHWQSNYNSGSPGSTSLYVSQVVDHDITIRDLYIDGQKRNGAAGHNAYSDPRTNASNVYMVPIRVHGCTNLLLENVSIYDPGAMHSCFSNIAWATFRNIRFCDPGYYAGTFSSPSPNTDGLHLIGPWQDVTIDGLSGTTGDDFLPLNAQEGNIAADVYAAGYQNAGPHIWGGWSNVYYGNGIRLTARNLRPVNCADVIRIQTGNDSITPNPANYLDHILIEDVRGSVVQGPMQSNSFIGSGNGGVVKRATFRDWDLDLLAQGGSNPPVGWQFFGGWTDVVLDNHRFNDLQGGSGMIGHQVNLGSGASIGRLAISGYSIREDSSESASVLPAVSITQGTIDELAIRDSGWYRNAATNQAFAVISGGAVNRVSLDGVSTNNLANQLSITGGIVTQIDTAGICHRNPATSGAAGGAAINVGTGVTVANLTACGSDTAKLLGTSAGTVTTKKTDATERGS